MSWVPSTTTPHSASPSPPSGQATIPRGRYSLPFGRSMAGRRCAAWSAIAGLHLADHPAEDHVVAELPECLLPVGRGGPGVGFLLGCVEVAVPDPTGEGEQQ